jgi:hypothetical protein
LEELKKDRIIPVYVTQFEALLLELAADLPSAALELELAVKSGIRTKMFSKLTFVISMSVATSYHLNDPLDIRQLKSFYLG